MNQITLQYIVVHLNKNGNTLRLWTGNNPGNNKPLDFSEGFDAYDTNPQQMYFSAASNLMTCLHENGFDVYLLDNKYGTQDIRNNAAGFTSAVKYIHDISGSIVIAGGVSMGGMIARNALAKAEGDGNPLPVSVSFQLMPRNKGLLYQNLCRIIKRKNNLVMALQNML